MLLHSAVITKEKEGPFALRASASLVYGLTVIQDKKAHYILKDVDDLKSSMQRINMPRAISGPNKQEARCHFPCAHAHSAPLHALHTHALCHFSPM